MERRQWCARGCFKVKNDQDVCVSILAWGINRKQRQRECIRIKQAPASAGIGRERGMS